MVTQTGRILGRSSAVEKKFLGEADYFIIEADQTGQCNGKSMNLYF
jgi:hypothetical protein